MDAKNSVAVIAPLFVVMAVGHAGRVCAARVEFQISAGPAYTTLRQFADQSHMNILFSSEKVGTQETHAVSGNLEPMEALRLMLTGSGLEYQFQEPDSVLVSVHGRKWSPSDGSCERASLEPCRVAPSEGEDLASTVTVTGMSVDAPFDSGQMHVVVPNMTLTRQEFSASGLQTVGDVLRSLPQNFGGGLNVGVIFAGGNQNTTSQSAASTVNLRGLGSDSTLVLVNGQRLAASEWTDAVDVTLIPISAAERGGRALHYCDSVATPC